MKLLGILRGSALCLLVSAFHGQPVSCGFFKNLLSSKKPKEDFSVTMSDLVFENSSWHDSQLASTVLLLEEFCKGVRGDKFSVKVSADSLKGLIEVCGDVSSYLGSSSERFFPKYGPGRVGERKELPMDLYENALKPGDGTLYAEWLKKNIPGIMASYMKMIEESVKLTLDQLKTETSTGPLKYGFVYTGDELQEMVSWLPSEKYSVPNFIDALKDFHNYLNGKLKNTPTKPTVKAENKEAKEAL